MGRRRRFLAAPALAVSLAAGADEFPAQDRAGNVVAQEETADEPPLPHPEGGAREREAEGTETAVKASATALTPLSFEATFDALAAGEAIGAEDTIAVVAPIETGGMPALVDHEALLKAVASALEGLPEQRRPALLPLSQLARLPERYEQYLTTLAAREATLALFVSFVDVDGRTMRRSRFIETDGSGVREIEWREISSAPATTPPPAPASIDLELHQCTAAENRVVCDLIVSREPDAGGRSPSIAGIAFAVRGAVREASGITAIGADGRTTGAPVTLPSGITLVSVALADGPAGREPLDALLLELVDTADTTPPPLAVSTLLELR